VYKFVKSTFCSGNNTEILAVMPSKLHLFRRTQNGVVHGKRVVFDIAEEVLGP
jgi:hypothetical protein